MDKLERSTTRVQGFQDKEMDFQLIRQLGSCAFGGASIGQCLHLATKIENGSPSSWVREFSSLARQQEEEAQQRLKMRHGVSAGELFLMACNSYRAAEYYASCIDPVHGQFGMSSRECFLQAAQCLAYDLTTAMIPFADQALPVYFCKPQQHAQAEKTLLIVSGFDGTLEEEFLTRGLAALKRGYNILLFAGPGQMDSYRFFQDSSFIPDFEKVATAVLDWLAARQGGDLPKTALLGISLGGYFATRAAVHEPRIKALIANSPITDLHAYMSAFAGFDPATIPDEEDFGVADLPMIPSEVMNEQMKLMSANLITRFGKGSMKETFARMHDFRVENEDLKQIKCPSLALVGEGEGGEPARQLEIFCRETGGPTATHHFTTAQGADSHCQVGNLSYSSGIMLDWLDELFA